MHLPHSGVDLLEPGNDHIQLRIFSRINDHHSGVNHVSGLRENAQNLRQSVVSLPHLRQVTLGILGQRHLRNHQAPGRGAEAGEETHFLIQDVLAHLQLRRIGLFSLTGKYQRRCNGHDGIIPPKLTLNDILIAHQQITTVLYVLFHLSFLLGS